MSLFPKFKTSMDPIATPATSATQPQKSSKSSESSGTPNGEVNLRKLYHQMAEAVRNDCWSIRPTRWLNHPEQWEQIRDLDAQLTEMERTGASEGEYRATLAQVVKLILIGHAQDLSEQGREHAGERAA